MVLKNLDSLLEKARKKTVSRIVVVSAEDLAVLLAVHEAMKAGIVTPVLVGNSVKIQALLKEAGMQAEGIQIIDEPEPEKAAAASVKLISQGGGDILMKGMIATAPFLRAVLDKEYGLKQNGTLSHFALFQFGNYHKLLGITDAAMNIKPEFNEKIDILNNATSVMRRLGVEKPKVAVLAPMETVNPKIESSVHAAMMTMMNKRNQIKGCLVDGPLALDNAISMEAAGHKGIVSEVAGDADIILVPDLDTGNALYKSIGFIANGLVAAIITGAKVPVVLTSRADSEHSKLMSIALAAALE